MARKTVKRIKLSGTKAEEVPVADTPVQKKVDPSPKEATKRSKRRDPISLLASPVIGTINYFKNSWQELRLVRWPNRRATWGLTFAVILFTLFFVAIIVLLDGAFQYLFKEVLLK